MLILREGNLVTISLSRRNIALLLEAVRARGLRLAGWVANQVDARMTCVEENVDTLRTRLAAPLLGFVSHQARPDAARVADLLRLPD